MSARIIQIGREVSKRFIIDEKLMYKLQKYNTLFSTNLAICPCKKYVLSDKL